MTIVGKWWDSEVDMAIGMNVWDFNKGKEKILEPS